ncbi:MAG: NAD-dependent epimerase/dehydratase family protein [Puniceicoccaceae bacterium]
MNVLVTGCAGFVGWKTTELLLAAGHNIIGLDNLNDYYSPALKQWRIKQLEGMDSGSFKFIIGDIGDRALLESIANETKLDAVINLAARAGVRPSIEQPEIYLETNVTSFLGLLEVMVKKQIKKLVHASSSSVYAGQQAPFREDQVVDKPLSPYAATKKASETLAYAYHYLHHLDISVVRYFTVYGPAGRPDMSPLRFTHCIASGIPLSLFGDGSQSRDFTYIDDIARGTVSALEPLGFEVLNIGGGYEPLSISSMISKLETYLGTKAQINYLPANPADMKDTSADTSKAQRLLGWQARVNPDEGLQSLVDWYLREKEWLAAEL